MKTLKLSGLGNDSTNRRSFFIFDLDEIFSEYFNKILEKIGLSGRIYDEQLPLSERESNIDHFKDNNFDIDVVYTSSKIIVLVRASQSRLEEFKSLILAYSTI